ncbi:MAG: hypothetical protein IK047_06210 [Clostridia bacterium]|nr:hypothetical protein [Clostridia bacterium]
MELLGKVALAFFAAAGVCLLGAEILRRIRTKKESLIRVCFTRERAEGDCPPDVIYIVRTECEAEEVVRRICKAEDRRIFIKRE